MTVLGVVMQKDPDERLDYPVDFSSWLEPDDYVVSAIVELAATTAVADTVAVSQSIVTVWLDGGASGEQGVVTVRATTNQGRVKEVGFRLRIRGS